MLTQSGNAADIDEARASAAHLAALLDKFA
jgi:hypothetical protein